MGWADYVKIKKIGEGSFGSAWLVKSNRDNKQYVIKQINVSKMPTKEREEAKKEVSVLAQMKHPNIVAYIDSFEEAGNLCIVMDYCDGGDLYTKIQSMRGVSINEDQIIDWFVQITLALKHVHDRKILHRDLKSQNIFLTKEGIIKLGDFGVAKVLNNTMELARTAIGTPYYMSPEICEHKPYNNKSDVWSLGCVLFELANMRHPFEANNLQMLIHKILRANFDPVNPKYSYELRNLVACMLKRNPRERPSVNGILRKPFIMKRCEKFLTSEKLMEEFSHTVLHGENFKNKLQNINLVNKPSASKIVPRPLVPASPVNLNGPVPAPPSKQVYDPSKIYKAPVVRRPSPALVQKSVDKKIQDIKKRIPSADRESVNGDRKTPLSFLEERQKKKAQEEALLKKKQRDLLDKQKHEKMRKDRENGWKNILTGSQELERSIDDEISDRYQFVNNNRGGENPVQIKEINKYAHYYEKLDEIAHRGKQIEMQQDIISNRINNPNNLPNQNRPVPVPLPRQISINNIINKPVIKQPVLDNYKKRQEEFIRNKVKGKGYFNNPIAPKPPLVKKDEKSIYEEKLKKIRHQNYLSRKPVSKNAQANVVKKNNSNDQLPVDNRIKRLAALRQQAEENIQKCKNDLEKRRLEAYEKERQYNENKIEKKVSNDQQPLKEFKPVPPIPLTEVFNAIGVVGKQISKNEVLKNPNEKYTPRVNENRKNWQKATDLTELENKTLLVQTQFQGQQNKEQVKEAVVSPRKNWSLPHETVIKALEIAELSQLNTNHNASSPEETLVLKQKYDLKRGETFVINKDKENLEKDLELSSSSSNSNLFNEKPPEMINKVNLFKDTINKVTSKFTPEKIATLKATNNLILGVTFGQFDLKNTKMLRTCSEPDLTKLIESDEDVKKDVNENNKENKSKNSPKVDNKKLNSTNSLGTKRLVKSLEDLDNIQESSSDNSSEEGTSKEDGDDDDDMGDVIVKTIKKNKNENKSNDEDVFDDITEVRQTMESILYDDNDQIDEIYYDNHIIVEKKRINKKNVCFASKSNLVAAMSVKECETPLDSLEVCRSDEKYINDDNDSEAVDLNGGESEDSDTEFEDYKTPMPLDENSDALSYSSIEEKRANLEKKLGAKKFIDGYPSLQNLVLVEEDDPKLKNKKVKKSYELFCKLFPNADLNLYQEFYDLIIADHKFNDN